MASEALLERRPSREAAHLYALQGYHVLDMPAEARFDRIRRLLAKELEVPMALTSLVDAERQWFKSRIGLDADSTPREVSFCAHAIQSDDVLVVEDAHEDQRFAHNPLVQGAPRIRFYAGAPPVTPCGLKLVQDVSDRIRLRLDAVRDFLKASEPPETASIDTAALVAEVLHKLEDAISLRRGRRVDPLHAARRRE